MNRRTLLGALAASAALPMPAFAQARPWPSQPIRVIIPFAAGVTDTLGRLVTLEMGRKLGQTFVAENRPGAGGNIGAEACARAAPDGNTICMGTISSHAINPAIMARMPYDNLRDFAPITQLSHQPNALVINNDVPARTLAEFIALVKARPGFFSYATSGVGTSTHLAGEAFAQMVGAEVVHVPYRGSGGVMTAVMSGETPMSFDNLSSVLPLAREGRIRLIGVGSKERIAAAPDVPAIAEALPGFESLSWHGLFAPANTPPAIVTRLHAEAVAALREPALAARLTELGFTLVGSSPDEFRAFIAAETQRWGDVARRANLRVE
ncbi:Bug family tripartite tricarboxylate transporter substrate binding protein [Falsiroseomonas sp.]|jgi:tripartite-type tricarboxylate transporter receptor subunit TctC|uniref:Bug family tripartite tricarboxylate transporter substrate binding protein n=1 Tax=Falsiroseomonas sp. TaxID=2870721 RepID=UPI003F71F47E